MLKPFFWYKITIFLLNLHMYSKYQIHTISLNIYYSFRNLMHSSVIIECLLLTKPTKEPSFFASIVCILYLEQILHLATFFLYNNTLYMFSLLSEQVIIKVNMGKIILLPTRFRKITILVSLDNEFS